MAEDKHLHDWNEESRVTNISLKKMVTTIYYTCTGCPMTKTESEEK